VIPTSVRIFVCTERQDMRRSFDALALAVRESLALDPESGALFVFASKRSNRLKVLWFDHNGYLHPLQAAARRALRASRRDRIGPTRRRDQRAHARDDPPRRRKVISRSNSR
jgi:transposase